LAKLDIGIVRQGSLAQIGLPVNAPSTKWFDEVDLYNLTLNYETLNN